jgi:gliding motility-associated-like protein
MKKILLKLSFVLIFGQVLAQPSNDNCSGAIEVFPTSFCQTITGDVTGATQSMAGCSGTADDDVWFKFTAQQTDYKVQVNGSSGFNPVLEFFDGTCGSLNSVNCVDDNYGNGTSESTSFSNLTIGNTYFFRVYHYSSLSPSTKTFDLCLYELATMPQCDVNSIPAADDCSGAQMICNFNGYCGNTLVYNASTAPNGYNVNTWAGLTTAFWPSINNNSFMKFVASSSTISFDVWVYNSNYNYGIQIGVLEIPTCGNGAVTANYINSQMLPTGTTNYHSISVSGLTPGSTYYIMVDGYAGDACDYTIGLPPNSGFSAITSVTPTSETICLGSSIDLNAFGGNGTYTWTSSNISDLNVTSGNTVTATPTSIGTKTYTVNSSVSNPSCPPINTADAVITVVNSPTVTLTDSIICDSQTIELIPAVSTPGGSYQWSDNSTGNSLIVTPTTTTTYNLTYTVTGCSPANVSSTVTVYNTPVVDFTPSTTTICESSPVLITNFTTDATTYNWSTNDGLTSTLTNPTFNFTSSGLKTIKLVASNPACKDSLTQTDLINVLTTPVADFSLSETSLNTNSPTVTITNNSSNASTTTWDFGDNTTSNDNSSSFDHTYPIAQGTYTIKLIVENGICIDSTQLGLTVSEELLYFIPNSFTPNNNDANNPVFLPKFTSGISNSNYKLTIRDRWGKEVFESTNPLLGWDGKINGNPAPIGTYIWQVHFEETKNDSLHNEYGMVNLIK